VGLSERLDLSEEVDKEVLGREIEGKVVAWGSWVGVYERTLGMIWIMWFRIRGLLTGQQCT